MKFTRRQFLKSTAIAAVAAASITPARDALAKADGSNGKSADRKAGGKQVVSVDVRSGEALQQAMKYLPPIRITF